MQQERDGNQQNGEQQAKPGEEKSPVSSEGDNDAEAFDRIQKHMERKGELKKDEASPRRRRTSERRSRASRGREQRQGDKETGRQGESEDKQQGRESRSVTKAKRLEGCEAG